MGLNLIVTDLGAGHVGTSELFSLLCLKKEGKRGFHGR